MTETGELPKKPCKNRKTSTLCKSCATATGICMMAKMVKPIISGSLRPYSSERGPAFANKSVDISMRWKVLVEGVESFGTCPRLLDRCRSPG